ncbi:Glycine cleavage system transcriptional activator [Roseivivax sp. THAF40]|uniref:LysR substrate-binding domain-containing protein n=1 Tax=unclassified Roseivivax TaxID=2639302 RepID=UPI001268BA84|nr:MULTISPECIES: LysR substrate-binding domain-containing protein [unclassified Roseivivax]QFS82609.1 Glycine cleavage system transcriptional activator [Roseivivax sp. THAF197b]QFT46377.1 Glycine cleavage system transcriptional activator [Roseivivax sp. THAF40]
MSRKYPPFAAVRAFEAAARRGSVKAAAEELCLTASAVSHQIRALETYLDTDLFIRSGNRVELTLTGRTYARKMTALLDLFDETTRNVKEAGHKPFRVHCTPGFAARWLVPRLNDLAFGDRVRISVSNGAPSTDFSSNGADVVIQWADAHVPGVITEPLMQSARYPVASPALKAAENLRKPEDLRRVTLMHDETMDAWQEWFQAADVTPPAFPRGPRFPNCELATTAAEKGQGVALAYDAVVRDTLKNGTLVRLFDAVTMPFVIYSVAYTIARKNDPMVREFSDWLHNQVEAEGVAAKSGLAQSHA